MNMTTVLVICLALIPIAVGIVALGVLAVSRKIIGRPLRGRQQRLNARRGPNLPARLKPLLSHPGVMGTLWGISSPVPANILARLVTHLPTRVGMP